MVREDSAASAALDAAVEAQQRVKTAQARYEFALVNDGDVLQAHAEACDADGAFRLALTDLVSNHPHLLHDPDSKGWLITNLKRFLGWSDEQVSELEDATQYKGDLNV